MVPAAAAVVAVKKKRINFINFSHSPLRGRLLLTQHFSSSLKSLSNSSRKQCFDIDPPEILFYTKRHLILDWKGRT